MHGFDIFRVLGLLGRQYPPEVLVFGVEPRDLDWSMELSLEVSEALPFLLKAVRRELGPDQQPPVQRLV
jgi:Ni,Fe-hydrogenase maturation factor